MPKTKRAARKRAPKKTAEKAPRLRAPGLDPIKLLAADHQTIRSLFTELEELNARASAKGRALYVRIKTELLVHSQIEEELVYPVLERMRSKETKKLALEAFEEHAVAKLMLREIDRSGSRADSFRAKMKVLRDIVLHHVEEEERDIFPKLRRGLPRSEREVLGARIVAFKQQLSGQRGRELEALSA